MINLLRELREERGWSILQLSAKSGVPKEKLMQVEEMGDVEEFAKIQPIWVLKVARPFGMRVSEIFKIE